MRESLLVRNMHHWTPRCCLILLREMMRLAFCIPVSKNIFALIPKQLFSAITNTSVSGLLTMTLGYDWEACLAWAIIRVSASSWSQESSSISMQVISSSDAISLWHLSSCARNTSTPFNNSANLLFYRHWKWTLLALLCFLQRTYIFPLPRNSLLFTIYSVAR